MARAWIALGSNLGDPPAQLREALRRLDLADGLHVQACSRFYRSAPLGPPGQDPYCNAVCRVATQLSPPALLAALQRIESDLGRDRTGPRWSARRIDLDLLIYEGHGSESPALTLPHPELHRRNFVLGPLADLDPALRVPGHGNVADLLDVVGREGLSLW